jgi:hypothetical protein
MGPKMTKVLSGLLAAFLLVIVAAKVASNVSMDTGDQVVNEAWAQNKMEFVTWNDGQWTAWIHDGVFEQAPQDTDNWSRHTSPGIAFTNWQGEPWQAKIEGRVFLLAKHGNWQGPIERSDAIRYLDWYGNKRLRTIAGLER